MALLPVVLMGWAGGWAVLLFVGERGIATAMPLLVLAGGYEAIHALHVGVERIGRYLQVSYEATLDGPLWESVAMRLGPGLPGGGIDPLFVILFVVTSAANLLMTLPRTSDNGLSVLGILALHGVFIARLVRTRRAAAHQRASDLDRMRAARAEILRSGGGSGSGVPRP